MGKHKFRRSCFRGVYIRCYTYAGFVPLRLELLIYFRGLFRRKDRNKRIAANIKSASEPIRVSVLHDETATAGVTRVCQSKSVFIRLR